MRPALLRSWDRTPFRDRWFTLCLALVIVWGVATGARGEDESSRVGETHQGKSINSNVSTDADGEFHPPDLAVVPSEDDDTEVWKPAKPESPEAAIDSAEPEVFAEPSKPDEALGPVRPHIETIDGAPYDGNSQAPPSDEDPFPSGCSLRWLMPVDGFGITDLDLSTVDHRPRFSDDTRFNINLPFGIHFVDEPQALGVPSELFSAQIETRLVQPIGELYGFDVSVIPGWFSDFDAGDNNGFRVTGHGMATVMLSDDLQFALGAMYLGREDVRILPAGGLVWTIQPDTKLELLMPKPRISQRIAVHEKVEQYVYTGFELFGGNSWAVTRPDDSYDTFTYRDFRFIVGHEVRGSDKLRHFSEIGYVFARKLEFERSPETLEPGGTLLLRIGSSY